MAHPGRSEWWKLVVSCFPLSGQILIMWSHPQIGGCWFDLSMLNWYYSFVFSGTMKMAYPAHYPVRSKGLPTLIKLWHQYLSLENLYLFLNDFPERYLMKFWESFDPFALRGVEIFCCHYGWINCPTIGLPLDYRYTCFDKGALCKLIVMWTMHMYFRNQIQQFIFYILPFKMFIFPISVGENIICIVCMTDK